MKDGAAHLLLSAPPYDVIARAYARTQSSRPCRLYRQPYAAGGSRSTPSRITPSGAIWLSPLGRKDPPVPSTPQVLLELVPDTHGPHTGVADSRWCHAHDAVNMQWQSLQHANLAPIAA